MVGRWSAAAYSCLTVALYVSAPSHVELTVQDHVRVDQLVGDGAEPYGELVPPGTTAMYLTAGTYLFRTTQDALVRLADATTVQVVAAQRGGKDTWPDPDAQGDLPASKGDTAPDEVPTLTVVG
jgi:hypothetical protein